MVLYRAFHLARRSWRMIFWMYVVNFLVGLLVLLPVYATLRSEMGASLEYLKLLNGFDYTVYADFMHNSSSAIDPLLVVGCCLGGVYVVISVFFSGGMVSQLSPRAQVWQSFQLSRFLSVCVQYFGRFFRLFLCVSSLVLLSGFVWVLIGSSVGFSLSSTVDEQSMAHILLTFVLLFVISTLFVICVGDYAKILMLRQDVNRVLPAFWQSMQLVFVNFRIIFGYYLILMSMGVAFFAIYFLIDSWIITSGWLTIIFLFIIQQVFIFSRLFLKVWTLATAMQVFVEHEKQPIIYQSL